jgi:hypothetical protein
MIKLGTLDKIFVNQIVEKYNYDPELLEQVLIDYKKFYIDQYSDFESQVIINHYKKPSNILSLDLQFKGINTGISQIYGPEDSLKSSLLVYLANESDVPFFVHVDPHPFRWEITNPEFIYCNEGYRVNEIVKKLISTGVVSNIFIDSITTLNRHSDLIKTSSKILTNTEGLSFIFTNQTRANKYDKSQNTPAGGDLLHSVCNTIFRITNIEKNWAGKKVSYLIEKDKVNSEFANKRFQIYFDRENNLCNELDLIDMAISENIVKRTGTLYKYKNNSFSYNEIFSNENICIDIWKDLGIELNHENYLGKHLINKTI